jgi:periplasmic divalent cation tolerance protein
MTELSEVVITAPDPEWLFRLTRALVADGLCASAHNFTPVRTVYKWQGQIYERTEGRASLHTRAALVSRASCNETSALPVRLWTLLLGETYRKRMDGETRDEIATAAAAHRELGRGYDEAVAEALVERIGAEIDKRIDARLGVSPRRSRSEVETSQVSRHQAMWTGAVIGAGITGVAAMFAEASHSPHLWAVAIWIIVVAIAGLSPAVARRYRSQSQS